MAISHSGLKNEQICYCSFDLCNELSSATSQLQSQKTLQIVIITVILLHIFNSCWLKVLSYKLALK